MGGGIRLLSQLAPALARHSGIESVRLAVPSGIDWESFGLTSVPRLELFELAVEKPSAAWLRRDERVLGIPGTGRLKRIVARTLTEPEPSKTDREAKQLKTAAQDCDVVYAFWPQTQPVPRTDKPLVCTFQDTTLLDFPEIMGMTARDAEFALSQEWLWESAQIVVSSRATQNNLKRLFGDLGKAVVVIPHAILPTGHSSERRLSPALAHKLPPRYIIFPSNITSHKNHYALLVAWSRFSHRGDLPLVLFGAGTELLTDRVKPSHMLTDRVRGIIVRSGMRPGKDLYTLGYVDDVDVLPLIKGATALIMPTLAEGGGSYPVEEALSVGVPVLCSDIPVMREHLSTRSAKIAWFDPESPDSILRALQTLLDNYEEFKRSALDGMSDSRYTWDDIAAQYVDVFHRAIKANTTTEQTTLAAPIDCREIEKAHYELLSSFLAENDVPAVVGTFTPFPMTDETARKIALGARQDRYYGVFLDKRIVGLSMLRGWDEGYSVPSFGIIVDHRFHNRGIGGRLTDFTIGEARRLGCDRVRLTVYASNAPAVHIYASKGFVESQREPVLRANGPDEKIVMIKEL